MKKTLNILIVEDDRINNMYLQSLLQQYDWNTQSAYNGLEAIEKQLNNEFDIILMDGQMPKMDGFEAIRNIRNNEKEKNTHIPIIAITGFASPSDKELFYESGADDIVTKPINEEDLLTKINALLLK